MTDEVILRVENGLGRITLNRPAALHALNEAMCHAMDAALRGWAQDGAVRAVLVDHTGPRGFCAGGDIRMLAESGAGDGRVARAFFAAEYKLNTLIQGYPKPYVAILDGITMGGGVGISVHGTYRVATERTVFAMPETGIGLFPDVGGGWFLPRLPGEIGCWLALTGARIRADDCVYAGVATHFTPSAEIEALKAALIAGGDAGGVLAAADRKPGEAPLAAHRAAIDGLFAHYRAEDIFAALAADGGEWAAAQLKELRTKSPQTIKVALRQIRTGARLSAFADVMRMEYRIASRVVRRHDFLEGVRAVIVDKDNAPRWSPETLEGVSEAMLDDIFAPLPAGEELAL
ncbi:MAG: enoyl-CoA hydratase/isomerase family protein [Hyphomonadaceae bacterium]